MRKTTLLILCLLAAVSTPAADTFKYRIGGVYGLGNAQAGEKPNFSFNHRLGIAAGTAGDRFSLSLGVVIQKNYSDSAASGHFTFFADKDKATYKFSSVRAGFDVDYRLKGYGTVRPTIGFGLGYMIWELSDPAADTVYKALDDKGSTVDYSAAEMYLAASAGLEITLARQWAGHITAGVDYLTGVGTSFADEINDDRPRMLMRLGLSVSYLFGREGMSRPSAPYWPSSESWSQQEERDRPTPAERDSDGDGIVDKHDKCPDTPPGAYTDRSGCPSDGDGDGVWDGLDDCPKTPRAARGRVDIFGCPIDSDYDGVPDYLDSCNTGPVGAAVDEFGCPLDSDGDGVYDGLDDCPATQTGIEVDGRGCIDIGFLQGPMVIHIDYQSGSFEIDQRTRTRLQPLIRKLKILTNVDIEIYGYTDNVGPAEANQSLSQKRANRMRDWLASEGIDGERLKPIGRGETNFIASNDTAEGRAENRRIELVFISR